MAVVLLLAETSNYENFNQLTSVFSKKVRSVKEHQYQN